MQRFITVMLVVVGIIHLLPLSGVLGAERLSVLYGMSIADPNLLILMRHRAVLFGLLGLFILYAAFRTAFQPMAFVAGYASVVSFLWLAWSSPAYNALLGRVVLADIVALACLALASAAYAVVRSKA